MPRDRAERELGPIWCPHCEKVTDHRMSQLQRVDPDDLPLEPAEPPLGTRLHRHVSHLPHHPLVVGKTRNRLRPVTPA